MPQLIKRRAVVEDDWELVRDHAALAAIPADRAIIVPLSAWTTDRHALAGRGRVGVWLAPSDEPGMLAEDVATLPVIAVDFPQFVDGRGYSTARLLREKYGFQGELRAIGDILRDQLYYLEQCGFDAFSLRADRDLVDALASFGDFSDSYQATALRPIPLFSRRQTERHDLAASGEA
jgi:uncharacterized protein (DUF934 family)